MFSILIHDEFWDHVPTEYAEYNDLETAYDDYKSLKKSPLGMYDEGLELVYDTDDGERLCLEYYTY